VASGSAHAQGASLQQLVTQFFAESPVSGQAFQAFLLQSTEIQVAIMKMGRLLGSDNSEVLANRIDMHTTG